MDTQELSLFRATCTYQMYGDLEPETWAHRILSYAKENGLILEYAYLGHETLSFGIENVKFSIDVSMYESLSEELQKDTVLALLNDHVIHDSDVVITNFEKIQPDD